jgi:hypothetical protein
VAGQAELAALAADELLEPVSLFLLSLFLLSLFLLSELLLSDELAFSALLAEDSEEEVDDFDEPRLSFL